MVLPRHGVALAGPLVVGTLLALAAYAGVHACPTENSDHHLTAYGYTISDSDLRLSGSDSTPPAAANITNMSVVSGDFSLIQPAERTGIKLASGGITAQVRCPKVLNHGCSAASEPGVNGNSSCIGCAGPVSVAVEGLGAWDVSGNHSLCGCSSAGVVSTPDTIYHAQAANPHYFTAENNCTGGASCTTEHKAMCDAQCSCNADGEATPSSPPSLCGCSCRQNMCNTMHNHTVAEEASHGSHGQNCSCSLSGVPSGASGCGCSCRPTIFVCSCTRQTCGSRASPDSKTFTSTGGVSVSGGGTCKVTASCNHGFYDGGIFTAYNTPSKVFPELFLEDLGSTTLTKISSEYLSGTTPTYDYANNIFRFTTLKVTNLAVLGFHENPNLKLAIGVGTPNLPAIRSTHSAPFAAWPSDFKVVQTAVTSKQTYLSDEYQMDLFGKVDIGNYTLHLLDSNGAVITGTASHARFNASVSLITGSGYDSSSCSSTDFNYPTAYTDLTTNATRAGRHFQDLIVFSRNAEVEGKPTAALHAQIKYNGLFQAPDSSSMNFGINIRNIVGECFGLVFKLRWMTGETRFKAMAADSGKTYFRIVPGLIFVGGSPIVQDTGLPTSFAAEMPSVVKVDGGNTNATMNVDGLPNPLIVAFQDGAGGLLKHGTCNNCVQARVVRCTDATSKASSASSSSTAYPTCGTVEQADCAASANGRCSGSTSYLDTLTGTTVVNMVDGLATFTDLQLSFVVGAGYKLQFTHNAEGRSTTKKAFSLKTLPEKAQVVFPSGESNANNSFFVRPYALGQYFQIGGDGVDKNSDGQPDGVGNGKPFRWQPVIYLKGKNYDFTMASNAHGWTPVTAEIKTCAGQSCAGKSMKLTGTNTPPVWHSKTQSGDTGFFSDVVTKQSSTHMRHYSWLGKLGMVWTDLDLFVNDTASWQNDVVLTFKVGPGEEGRTQHTSIDSNLFDVFAPPDPPRNLRVHSYGELGFRVEFDPAPSSAAQPLTGFMIEIDQCEQDATRCSKRGTATSPLCANDRGTNNIVLGVNASSKCFQPTEGLGRTEGPAFLMTRPFGFELGLGSDLTTGGGYTEEVMLNYTDTTPGEASGVNFYINPTRTLYAGDELVLDFGRSYKFLILGDFTTCTFTGTDAASVEVSSFDKHSATLTIKVSDDKKLLATKPVTFTAPASCNIKLAPTQAFPEDEHLQTVIHAPVMGVASSSRGDNCKGTTPGCVVKATYGLTAIHDESSLDVEWKGHTKFGGADDLCRTGQTGSSNVCSLSIGQDWSMGVTVEYDWTHTQLSVYNETVANEPSDPLIKIDFERDRAIAIGDWIDIPLPGLFMSQPTGSPSGGQAGNCNYFVEKTSSPNVGPANFSSVIPGTGLANFTKTAPQCKVFVTEVYMPQSPDPAFGGGQMMGWGWESLWNPSTSVLSLHVGSSVVANTPLNISVHGFKYNGDASLRQRSESFDVDAKVRRGRRTTVIFKNGADSILYSGSLDPTSTASTTLKGLKIEAGQIYNFRVYAYNGRFKSAPTTTRVQNRAIQKPQIPAYFTQIKQEVLGVELRFTTLPKDFYQSSPLSEVKAYPITPAFGSATRVGIGFTPEDDIVEGTILTLKLPKFSSSPGEYSSLLEYFPFWNGKDSKNYLLQDTYEVDGKVTFTLNDTVHIHNLSHGCSCDADGSVTTPRTKFLVTRIAYGSEAGAENSSAGIDVVTGMPAPATAIPAKACGGCSCSLEGNAYTPPSIYNTTGNCTSCRCSADGIPSHDPQAYVVKATPGEGTMVPAVNGSCFNCTCSADGVMSSQPFCSGCTCQQKTCNCACPLFRKCECGCKKFEEYKCGCRQKTTSTIFSQALWSTSTESLMLTVAKGRTLEKGVRETVWIDETAHLTMPPRVQDWTDSAGKPWVLPRARLLGEVVHTPWGFRSEAQLPRFKLNWVSSFPTSLTPRMGFVVQFTTDLFWKSNIQTVYYPDDLSEGIAFPQLITTLDGAVDDTVKELVLTDAAIWLRPGQHVHVQAASNAAFEIMKVVKTVGTTLHVVRGQFKTTPIAHADDANVNLVIMGATDPSIEGGIDTKIGSPGGEGGQTSCRLGNPVYEYEGCNPSTRYFPNHARVFSSGVVVAGESKQASLASACVGNATTCTGNCLCVDVSATPGADLGGPRPRGLVKLSTPGDVLGYPLDFRGRITNALSLTADVLTLDSNTKQLQGKYIRIGSEIMFVLRAGPITGKRSVESLSTFKAQGGSHCSCSIAGVAAPAGGSCSCFGSQGVNCTADGTVSTFKGGGQGFTASFTVHSGMIRAITITNPGENYTTLNENGITIDDQPTGGGGYGHNWCNVKFYPTLSMNNLAVLRAQLGTTIAQHASGSRVDTVLWPSQKLPDKPTKRYSFRIAAYSKGGLSPFSYYDLVLKGKSLQKLLPAGNELLEISLTGGALDKSNITVHLVTPGVTDVSRGKECVSVQVLDRAGTRLSCRTPAWVGAKFDVIVSYRSGMFWNYVVGAGWLSYKVPVVEAVVPSKLDPVVPKTPVTITVRGANFGTTSADVKGKLVGDDNNEYPCNPLTVVGDTMIECVLTTKSKEDQLVGNIVIKAGNATVHGGGQDSKTSKSTSYISQKPQPVEVKTTIAADFTEITSSPAKVEEFKATFTGELAGALGVSPALLEIIDIIQGSVIVIFNILPDTSSATTASPAALAVNLAQQAADPNSALRAGSLTGAMTVTLPPGTAELAAASEEADETAAGDVPNYFKSCVPRTYTSFDMEVCYDCCTYLCETGTEVPQLGGQDVLPGYRAQVCQSECMTNCGYARPLNVQQ